ncbi:MAG: hypothetical protein K6T83_01175 [Alicyclobacillus sp.]|nr:hypothetical protein [Alicyclobacillus sp.]
MLETIKQYLVSLGFRVDKSSFGEAQKTLSTVDKGLRDFASGAVLNFGKAAAAVAAFMAAANAGINHFISGLGDQEIQMEMLSRQFWTTQQQAQAFNATLQAMHANLQELYLSPTLMKQYQQLHGVALEMQTPSDYKQQISQVQDLQLQFKQLRLEAYYALQWIGYYFIKYMSGPISKVHDVLQSINQVIIKNMPTWTKKVAEVMASFVQAGTYIVQALGQVWNWLQKLAQYVPGWAKAIAAGLAVLSVSNPFMLFVEGIGAAILLLDDFETYLHHGTSALAPFWRWLVKVYDEFKKSGEEQRLLDGLKNALNWVATTAKKVRDSIVDLYDKMQKNGTLKAFADTIGSLWRSIKDLASGIGDVVTGIGHLFGILNKSQNQSDLENFFQLIADLAMGAIKIVAGAIEEIASLAKIVGDVLHGNWKGAWNVLQDIWTGQNLADIGIIPQWQVTGAKGPPVGPKSYPYMFQTGGSPTTKNVTVHANQTNHIHGSSPQGTANAIQHSYNRHLHNLRGVIQ